MCVLFYLFYWVFVCQLFFWGSVEVQWCVEFGFPDLDGVLSLLGVRVFFSFVCQFAFLGRFFVIFFFLCVLFYGGLSLGWVFFFVLHFIYGSV